MRFRRKTTICMAALVGVGLGSATTADAACRHIGRWTLMEYGYVCQGFYTSGNCIWTDDCRVNAE